MTMSGYRMYSYALHYTIKVHNVVEKCMWKCQRTHCCHKQYVIRCQIKQCDYELCVTLLGYTMWSQNVCYIVRVQEVTTNSMQHCQGTQCVHKSLSPCQGV